MFYNVCLQGRAWMWLVYIYIYCSVYISNAIFLHNQTQKKVGQKMDVCAIYLFDTLIYYNKTIAANSHLYYHIAGLIYYIHIQYHIIFPFTRCKNPTLAIVGHEKSFTFMYIMFTTFILFNHTLSYYAMLVCYSIGPHLHT